MTIGEKIKLNRLKLNLTQEQLGQEIMVSRKTVSGWENNRSIPDINTLIDLSNLFDLSLDYLIKDDAVVLDHYEQQEKTANHNHYMENILYVLLIPLLVLNYLHLFGQLRQIRFVPLLTLIVLIMYLCFFTDWQRFQTKKKLVWLLISFVGSLIVNIAILIPDNYIIKSFSRDAVINMGQSIGLIVMVLLNTLCLNTVMLFHPFK